MEGEATKTRIYVGGLGERVTEDDLRKTFSSLGSIESVDIIRTKGRSFAYINFIPSSQKSLAKLFSMYNGCSWKGGKLKLEKAKEHYVDRLKREWAEDAELENSANSNHSDVDGNMAASVEPKSKLDLEKDQICIFFPKLRKVKSLPFRGTGKHKYSFQRVEVPSLPVHMCDCCLKDSDPGKLPGKNFHNASIQDQGINEEEVNIMNSVLNKLLLRETRSESECSRLPRETQIQDSEIQDSGVNGEEINLMDLVMKKVFNRGSSSGTEHKDLQDPSQQSNPVTNLPTDNEIDNATEDDDDDDDDIKINLATGQDDVLFLENWGLQTSLANETERSNEQLLFDVSASQSKQANQERKFRSSNKKRKSLSDESNENDWESPKLKKKARLQTQSSKSEEALENVDCVTGPGTKTSSKKGMWSQKSSRKELVVDGTTSSFSVSHVVPGGEFNDEEKPKTGDEGSSIDKERRMVDKALHVKVDGHSSPSQNQDKPPTTQPGGQSSGADKSTRGSSWLQKYPWTQLVGYQNNSSSFSISQILPMNMLEKQDLQKPNTVSTSNKEPGSSGTALHGSQVSKPAVAAFNKKKNDQLRTPRDVGPSKTPSVSHHSDETTEKKTKLGPKPVSNSGPMIGLGVRVSETCPFMRNADSLKERTPTKSAQSGLQE